MHIIIISSAIDNLNWVSLYKSNDLLISSILNNNLTNSMAYGTRRFNAAFTRAL